MIVAFALLWIPYVAYFGYLLAFIGVVYLWLGRTGFNESHRRLVVRGAACVVLALVLGVVVGISFADAVVAQTMTPGQSLQALGASLQMDLAWLLVFSVVVSAISSLGYVTLPYALADGTSRLLLWGGLVLSIGIASIALAVVLLQLSMAIAQSTSGTSIDLAPIQALETQFALWGSAQFVPYLMFLWAYSRTRRWIFVGGPDLGGDTGVATNSGRIY